MYVMRGMSTCKNVIYLRLIFLNFNHRDYIIATVYVYDLLKIIKILNI